MTLQFNEHQKIILVDYQTIPTCNIFLKFVKNMIHPGHLVAAKQHVMNRDNHILEGMSWYTYVYYYKLSALFDLCRTHVMLTPDAHGR